MIYVGNGERNENEKNDIDSFQLAALSRTYRSPSSIQFHDEQRNGTLTITAYTGAR